MKKRFASPPFVWNLVLIALYISWERWVYFPANPFNPKIHIPFYVLEILYYVFACYVYLPYIFTKYRNHIIRLFLIISILAFYICFYAVFNTLLLSLLKWQWTFLISKDDWKMSSYRSVYILGIAVAVWMGRYLILSEKRNAEYKLQKLETEKRVLELENAYLKAQLSPHMIFNSLTSLYNKVVIQAPDAPQLVLLLIDLMDYSMANGKEGERVYLEDDLRNIGKTIQLNQGLSGRILHCIYSTELDDEEVLISPMLMQSFIDNIFKHGNLQDQDYPATIRIELKNRVLHFHSWNKIGTEPSLTKRGIGLNNARQRLINLYPESYELLINEGTDDFEIDLKLFL